MGFGSGGDRPQVGDPAFGFVAGTFGEYRAHFHRDRKHPDQSFLDVYVPSSNGRNTYNVIVSYDLGVDCSCLGWSYRQYCRHASKIRELLQDKGNKFVESVEGNTESNRTIDL